MNRRNSFLGIILSCFLTSYNSSNEDYVNINTSSGDSFSIEFNKSGIEKLVSSYPCDVAVAKSIIASYAIGFKADNLELDDIRKMFNDGCYNKSLYEYFKTNHLLN